MVFLPCIKHKNFKFNWEAPNEQSKISPNIKGVFDKSQKWFNFDRIEQKAKLIQSENSFILYQIRLASSKL